MMGGVEGQVCGIETLEGGPVALKCKFHTFKLLLTGALAHSAQRTMGGNSFDASSTHSSCCSPERLSTAHRELWEGTLLKPHPALAETAAGFQPIQPILQTTVGPGNWCTMVCHFASGLTHTRYTIDSNTDIT
jgi:hypothetical protein